MRSFILYSWLFVALLHLNNQFSLSKKRIMKLVKLVLPVGRSRRVRSGNLPSSVIIASACAAAMKRETSLAKIPCPKTMVGRLRTACVAGLLLLALPAVVQAQFTLTTNTDGSLNISQYTGPGGAVIIPSTINGLLVTSIGGSAFLGSGVTSVTIPNSVTNIGAGAFWNCGSLTTITIPNSVTSIVDWTFYECVRLASVTIPNSVTTIGTHAFDDCTSLASVTIPNSVTTIGDSAFSGSGVTSITIPNSVTNIGAGAFWNCGNLTSITIPNGVTFIVDGTFYECVRLASVTIPNSVTTIGSFAFYDCTSLTSVTIPNSVTTIGDSAFADCTSLTGVYFQGNAPSLGGPNVFAGDNNATVYYLPWTTGWGSTFDGRPTIPAGFLYTIWDGAALIWGYDGPGGAVTIPSYIAGYPVTEIQDEAFMDCTNLTSVMISYGVASIGNYAFSGCTNLTSITIPNSVYSIGFSTFSGCSSLTSVTMDNGLTILGYGAFSGCSSLSNITIPYGITSIPNDTFVYCTGLASITIPASVTTIGIFAFGYCSNLATISIPNSVTSIAEEAFYDCISLTNITMPASVTGIGDIAFSGCSNLAGIYFEGNAPSLGGDVFDNDNNLTAYYLPGTTGWGAFSTNTGLPTVPLNTPSIVTTQPASQTVNQGDSATFSVTASGTLPLSYQWLFNGTSISGATLSSLTIPNVVQTNLGTYAVVVTNGVGSVTSSNAVLSMYPFINAPFSGGIAYWGQTNTLNVGAWGTGPLYYQWFQNGVALQDATNQTLTLTSIQATNAGLYSVVVSSALGSVTNTPEQVVVEPAGVSLGFSPTLTINGVIGYWYIIQSTTNLADTNAWVTLTNLTLTQSPQLWVDTTVNASSPFGSEYFYRILPGQ